ncbi:MAG: response regulator [Flavisolibacter sp.]
MLPKKVLLAEDDVDDQKLFYEFLRHRPDIILLPAAENGEDLLHSLKMIADDGHLPDLIILDQNMPKRNGVQTLQILKVDDRYRNIPVVIYSTYADKQLIEHASKNGAHKVAFKPITREEYHQMMDDLLKLFA